jgi:uncharacterized protein
MVVADPHMDMAHVEVHREDVDLDAPTLIEGLPGVGLVGKIATDHLVDALDMTYLAACHCDGIPDVAVFEEGQTDYKPPVRLYADADHDLIALQSDVPVSPDVATEFAGCLTEWLLEQDATGLYISGFPAEKNGVPELSGVASGDAAGLLDDYSISRPSQNGLVSGPTGALLHEAQRHGLDALGLVVESNRNFPDPEAARVILVDAVEPMTGVDIDTDRLADQAEEISAAREELAKQMQEADTESSRAQPVGMFQ